MANVVITKTTTNSVWGSGTTTWTYTTPHFKRFRIALASPASVYGMPEDEAANSIIIKVLGNEMRIDITWVVKDESSNRVTGDITKATALAMDQIGFLTNEFQPTSILDRYTISLSGTSFTKTVLLESLDVEITDETTPIWTATLHAVVGDVVASVGTDAPRPPINLAADTTTADEVTLTWSAPGTSPVPTAYTVERRDETGDWLSIATGQSSPYTNSGLTTGDRHRYRVKSENASGQTGLPSSAVTAVVT